MSKKLKLDRIKVTKQKKVIFSEVKPANLRKKQTHLQVIVWDMTSQDNSTTTLSLDKNFTIGDTTLSLVLYLYAL